MKFNDQDPFPFVTPGEVTYAEEKAHSAAVDAWLGFQVQETERRLQKGPDGSRLWVGTDPAVFLTPYTELRRILALGAPGAGETVVDLGAAYGRMGFVVQRHFSCRFLGLEALQERVDEGNRVLRLHGCDRALLARQELGHSPLPAASLYFIYDFGSRRAVGEVLAGLRLMAQRQTVRVVGRGREVRDQIEREHPWLSAVCRPEHFPHYSLYRSAPG
jgi:hypothetical protein